MDMPISVTMVITEITSPLVGIRGQKCLTFSLKRMFLSHRMHSITDVLRYEQYRSSGVGI